MTKTKTVLNIPVQALSMSETLDFIKNRIDSNQFTQHVVVNAGKIVSMQTDSALRQSVLDADMINADGMSVVWASHFLGKALPARVAGIDLMLELVKMAHKHGYRCYFFGARQEVVEKVVDIFRNEYSSDIIAGYRNGYFKEDEEEQIAKDISASGANMLFVAMSSPKKEIFVNKYKKLMKVPFVMGVGGSFDVVAGVTKRAPKWMQEIGLEWFYRFVQEPGRMWKRYLVGNSKFILLVLKSRFKKQNE
ncbi:WecB/TagA/CpsF family glycosyltransferase [Alkalitalea saponilacus]|uniref:N-acetylglucosaminyldiphosphoundecaprenol N-acetyl-beta-D-mannosaminyltransferase n=1 Tax=Alkalitalea saponilacus TaxID=889453 RepID=A0A1T5FJZ3_9BACT|nr:WecB/TagA/CpsF family glycosyltransferase [Alkalitalea saponilacus]ASB49420.1 glycosyltransferase [Alkalitalea saponilacus]SKB96406.1 N-acetylglucosaminyldiphosphoundecaprenol N-acetyl-beta-D-mannosaminyltransferase [Alkalitalea saponilacus]